MKINLNFDSIAQLFYDTVHYINSKEYSLEQLNVWATGNIDTEEWNKSFISHYTIVAEIDKTIVGFGDIDNDYLDRLYVHKDYQRLGIATEIANKLEQYALNNNINNIATHASITALSFFKKRGYVVVREQQVERSGVLLTNYVMSKELK